MRETRTSEEPQAPVPAAATIRSNRSKFEAFYDKYDALIALLCIAAREDISELHERHYREHRAWFVKKYPLLKKHLARHLDLDAADCYYVGADRIPCDAFEALYLPRTIEVMFAHDGGALIERMMRTQIALSLWDETIAMSESARRLSVGPSEFRRTALPAF